MRTSIKTLTVSALTAAAVLAAPAAFAADTVTQGVTSGDRSVAVSGLELGAVPVSHVDTTGHGSWTLAVNDLSGTGAGWNVTQQVTSFVYDGSNGTNADIPAANFSVTPGAVTAVSGSAAGVTPTLGGTLDAPVKVVSAAAGSGVGQYTQAIASSLTVPADSLAGTYTGTLTTTINAAP